MFGTHDLHDAESQVGSAIFKRLAHHPLASAVETLRFPVGFFFIRGDRAADGGRLAEEVVKSYGYWNDDAGRYLDMVFPGWGKESGSEKLEFDRSAFIHCRQQLEGISKWRYSGQTDVLLLNYEAKRTKDGMLTGPAPSFGTCISLPVEEMIRKELVANLDQFMHELTVHARSCWDDPEQGGVWQISDRIGYFRGRDKLSEKLEGWLDVTGLYHELRPFAVCDLRPK